MSIPNNHLNISQDVDLKNHTQAFRLGLQSGLAFENMVTIHKFPLVVIKAILMTHAKKLKPTDEDFKSLNLNSAFIAEIQKKLNAYRKLEYVIGHNTKFIFPDKTMMAQNGFDDDSITKLLRARVNPSSTKTTSQSSPGEAISSHAHKKVIEDFKPSITTTNLSAKGSSPLLSAKKEPAYTQPSPPALPPRQDDPINLDKSPLNPVVNPNKTSPTVSPTAMANLVKKIPQEDKGSLAKTPPPTITEVELKKLIEKAESVVKQVSTLLENAKQISFDTSMLFVATPRELADKFHSHFKEIHGLVASLVSLKGEIEISVSFIKDEGNNVANVLERMKHIDEDLLKSEENANQIERLFKLLKSELDIARRTPSRSDIYSNPNKTMILSGDEGYVISFSLPTAIRTKNPTIEFTFDQYSEENGEWDTIRMSRSLNPTLSEMKKQKEQELNNSSPKDNLQKAYQASIKVLKRPNPPQVPVKFLTPLPMSALQALQLASSNEPGMSSTFTLTKQGPITPLPLSLGTRAQSDPTKSNKFSMTGSPVFENAKLMLVTTKNVDLPEGTQSSLIFSQSGVLPRSPSEATGMVKGLVHLYQTSPSTDSNTTGVTRSKP